MYFFRTPVSVFGKESDFQVMNVLITWGRIVKSRWLFLVVRSSSRVVFIQNQFIIGPKTGLKFHGQSGFTLWSFNNSHFESLVDHLIAGTCVSFWKKGSWLDEGMPGALVDRFIKWWDEITTKLQRKWKKNPWGWVISVWINACFVGFLQHLRWENDG